MHDISSRLKALSRPVLMVKTARIGQQKYRRERDLKEILQRDHAPSNTQATAYLLDIEHGLEHNRKTRKPGYSYAHHLDVLIALLSEADRYLGADKKKSGASLVQETPA